uniref:Purine permease n=1 Tax=Solanum tuberosum TaxID=4113 RepID=M1APS4_SOLTU
MSSGNNGAKKAEELHPHPVMEQLKNVQYCVNSPPPWDFSFDMSRQQYFISFILFLLTLDSLNVTMFLQYLPTYLKLKRPICDRFAMLFSIAIVWFYAAILTWSGAYKNENEANCRTDSSGLIAGSPWIDLPYLFLWGVPTFKFGDAFTMMIASFVASVESTGVFHASARYGSATPVPPSVISRGVGWLVRSNILFYSRCIKENAGLLAMTRVGSRRVVQISAGFMIFFSILGKFGALFASIPASIMAAMYCIFFGYMSSAGLGFLQFCNLNSFRTNFILGFSLFLGFSLPQYFREHHMYSVSGPLHTNSRWVITIFHPLNSVIFRIIGTN